MQNQNQNTNSLCCPPGATLEMLSSKYSLQNTWQVVLRIWITIIEKIQSGHRRESPELLHEGK